MLVVVVCTGARGLSVHGCLFLCIFVLGYRCSLTVRGYTSSRGRVLIVYPGAHSLGVCGCLALPLRGTGRHFLATACGRFMPVTVFIAHGA